MLRAILFAGLAGLHLAVLQFCYFFLLLVNVTSTYITYITVVVAWMVGTMIGLLWKRLKPAPALVAGIAAYYATVVLVLTAPLSSSTLPIAALGVAATGLWAGNLFVALLPVFDRADRLFLHENNGFLLGIVGVFVGFTLLGQPFLLGAPFLSALVQLLFLLWLHLRPPIQASDAHSGPGGEPGLMDLLGGAASDQLRGLARAVVLVNVLLPLGMLAHAALGGEPYWRAFHGEDNPITWFSSIQLVLVGLLAYGIHQTGGLLAEVGRGRTGEADPRRRWIWLVFALGFVFLALDERFEIHELLREEAFLEAGWFQDLRWLRPGDIGLFLYLGIGAVFAVVLMMELRSHAPALRLFLAAVAVSAVIVVVDGLPESVIRTWPVHRFWNSVFEEVGELVGQLLFLLSFVSYQLFRMRELGEYTGPTPREAARG